MMLACLVMAMAWVYGYSKGKADKNKKPRRWWEIVLSFSGITATPPEPQSGESDPHSGGIILIRNLMEKKTRPVSGFDGYRSPIFSFDDSQILALKGDTLVAVDTANGKDHALFPCPGLAKLVGVDAKFPEKILALKRSGPDLVPGWISLTRKDFTAFDVQPGIPESVKMLNYLKGWRRDYGDTVVEERKSRVRINGDATDVEKVEVWAEGHYLGLEAEQGNDARHRQPSLSGSRRLLVMIRSPL